MPQYCLSPNPCPPGTTFPNKSSFSARLERAARTQQLPISPWLMSNLFLPSTTMAGLRPPPSLSQISPGLSHSTPAESPPTGSRSSTNRFPDFSQPFLSFL